LDIPCSIFDIHFIGYATDRLAAGGLCRGTRLSTPDVNRARGMERLSGNDTITQTSITTSQPAQLVAWWETL